MRIRRFASVAATTGVALSSSLFVGVATASADSQPCGAAWTHPEYGSSVQTCPDWSPVGEIPVLAHTGKTADLVGTIDPAGSDWYKCQLRGESHSGPDGIANDWWAVTVADNGEPGVVPQIFFKGGANYEPDGGLQHC